MDNFIVKVFKLHLNPACKVILENLQIFHELQEIVRNNSHLIVNNNNDNNNNTITIIVILILIEFHGSTRF